MQLLQSVQLWNLCQEHLVKCVKTIRVNFFTWFILKISENACDSFPFPRNYTLFTGTISADESLGSHQLNSFAALLEENLQTSSESTKVQNPQLKKMADEKRPQKGGKRKEERTAFEIPEDLYDGYCTPDERIHGKETEK